MMVSKLYTIITVFAFAMSFISCTNDTFENELVPTNNPMQLVISAPMAPKTRTVIKDGDGINAPTDKAEQLKDGWAIHTIALFITDDQGGVVAGRKLQIAEAASNAGKIVFDLTQPTSAECYDMTNNPIETNNFSVEGKNQTAPKVGTYNIYAIANYDKDMQLLNKINAVISAIKSSTGSTPLPATNSSWTNLINHKLNSDNSTHLCDKNTDMVLTALQDIKITVGNKEPYKIKLLRSRARIRVTVRNESGKYPIHINSLSFTEFTKNNASLFPATLPTADVGIDPSGVLAIIPFNANDSDVPAIDQANPIASERTIFDGYILESGAPYYANFRSNLFRFNIGVTARSGRPAYNKYTIGDHEATARDGVWYMIKTGNKVIVPDNGKLALVNMPSNENLNAVGATPKKYFWEWKYKDSDWNGNKWGTLQSLGTSQYITEPSNGQFVRLGTSTSASTYMYLQKKQFFSWKNYSENYFNIHGDLKWHQQNNMPSATGGGWDFVYIKDEKVPAVSDESHSADLNLSKLENNQSFDVTQINRNDFYHIFINIRYNDNLGVFYFEVSPWTDKNLDIGFE